MSSLIFHNPQKPCGESGVVNLVLEWSTKLSPGTLWFPSDTTTRQEGGAFITTRTPAGSQEIYRLKGTW